MSLSPDGVSDPAVSSGPRPREAIPAGAKQAGDAKRGEGEARKAGEADMNIYSAPRKSPAVGGALSISPDGVSDPAAASGPRPSEAIPAGAKQAGDAKQGEGEARKAGEAGSYNSLIFLYLTFRFSLIVNSVN